MAANINIPPFPTFDCETDTHTLGERWRKYVRKFENLIVAAGIKEDTRKRALLLHYIGEPACDIFDTLPSSGTDYKSALESLNARFAPSRNVEYEVYVFRQLKQTAEETLEKFYSRLRKAATTCEFADQEREIKSQIIIGCISSKLRQHVLQHPTMKLSEMLEYGRTNELTQKYASEMEGTSNDMATMAGANVVNSKPSNNRNVNRKTSTRQQKQCMNCGGGWHKEGLAVCKARGQTCNKCGKQNHFAKVCLSKPDNKNANVKPQRSKGHRSQVSNANMVAQGNPSSHDTSAEYLFANQGDNSNFETVALEVMGASVVFMIDTGATVNIINNRDFETIQPTPRLLTSNKQIFPYGTKKALNVMGMIQTTVKHNNSKAKATFYVIKTTGPSILGKILSVDLRVVTFVNNINIPKDYGKEIIAKHPNIFTGIGKHNSVQVTLHIDKNIPPIAHKFRRIPFHVRQNVEAELKELLNKDIIEWIPDSEPTPWVSPIVIVPKKDKNIRICVDMRSANKAIQRERHVTPTIDDILYDLTGANIFSKLDLAKGYHQLELEQNSRQITTFATHIGLFRYKRLNFGINAAAEVFQNEIAKVIQGIPNVLNISDDLLIYGKNKDQHDEALSRTLQKLEESGLPLNRDKCIFGKSNLNFFGHIFSDSGMKPDPHKIAAIRQAKQPESQTEVRSLLGMLNFCSRYIRGLATLTQPLRELTKKNVEWQWTNVHQKAYDDIVHQLSQETELAYFDKDLKTKIWTDASPVGIAAILTQEKPEGKHKIISFASRSLSETEQRYPQIDREALAIAWSIEHYHLYVYGSEFNVVTDHKPLIYLFNKPQAKVSARLERWLIRLQQYTFNVTYRPGVENPADYLSRHPLSSTEETSKTSRTTHSYAHFLAIEAVPKSITPDELRKHTKADPTLQFAMQCLRSGKWHNAIPKGVNKIQIQSLCKIRQELAANQDNSLLLRGHRLIMPVTLQEKAINIAHSGHQGIIKTKQLLREKTWFYGIDKKVEDKITTCLQCNAATDNKTRVPLCITYTPLEPWDIVYIDHKGPLPSGEHLLVVVDDYSKFPFVEVVGSTAAKTNIAKLSHLFSIFGRPRKICTDNGPPYNSAEFHEFVVSHGIEHSKSTPLWPQTNGEVERFNRTLAKTLKIAHTGQADWKREIEALLLSYRATPHTTTKLSPAELFMNRKLDIGIPTTSQLPCSPTISKELAEERSLGAKRKNKAQYDRQHRLMKNPTPGDTVLIKQEQKNKMTTPYNMRPYIVTDVKGSMVTSERAGHSITRNASHCKVIGAGRPDQKQDEDEETHNSTIPPTKEDNPNTPKEAEQPRYSLRTSRHRPDRLIEVI